MTWEESPSLFGLLSLKVKILVGTNTSEGRFSFQDIAQLALFLTLAASVSLLFSFFGVDFLISLYVRTLFTQNMVFASVFGRFTGFSEVFTFSCVKLRVLQKWHDTIQFIIRTILLKIVLSSGLLSSLSQASCSISRKSLS